MILDNQTKRQLTTLVSSYNPKIPSLVSPILRETAKNGKFIVFSDTSNLSVDIEESVYALFHLLHDSPINTDSEGNPTVFYALGELPTAKRRINPIGNRPLDKGTDPHSGLTVSVLNDRNFQTLIWMKTQGILEPLQGASARLFSSPFSQAFKGGDQDHIHSFLVSLMTPDQQSIYKEVVRLGELPDMFVEVQTSSPSTVLPYDNSAASRMLKWKHYVSNNQITAFIDDATPFYKNTTLADMFDLNVSRYNSLQADKIAGVLDYRDEERTMNRIARAMLILIGRYGNL